MNKFELYCMIFYVLDADWDETKDPAVGEYLSGANPFVFSDIGSADPAVFAHFCDVIDEEITVENSFSLAGKYIADLKHLSLSKAFQSINKDEWIDCVAGYLSQEHKGQG